VAYAVEYPRVLSVAGQEITVTGGTGEISSLFTAHITVPYNKTVITLDDIVVAAGASRALFSYSNYLDSVTSINLRVGSNNHLYILTAKGSGADRVELCWDITVTLEAPLTDARLLTLCEKNIVTTGGPGTSPIYPLLASIQVPGAPIALPNLPKDVSVGPGAGYNFYTDQSYNTESNAKLVPAGASDWYIKVTAQDGTTIRYYKVSITRAIPSSDSTIHSIAGQPIIPVSGTGIYADPYIAHITVPNSKSRIVKAEDIVAHPAADVHIYSKDGANEFSSVDLNVGENHLYISVYAESLLDDLSFKIYDITVTRDYPAANPPAVSQTAVDSGASMTDTSVTLPSAPAGQTWEYRVSRDGGQTWGAWQDSPVFSGLAADKTYTFQIRTKADAAHSASAPVTVEAKTRPTQGANNGDGNGGANNDDGKQTTNPPAGTDAGKVVLPKTKITKVAAGKRLAKISFKKVAKANKVTKYQLSYRYKNGSKYSKWKSKTYTVKYTGKTTATVTLKKLKTGKRYQLRLRALKTVSGKKYYASWSASKLSGKVK
jgi:hypothetical protein